MIHIWCPRKLSNFQYPPSPFFIYVKNSSTSLTLDVKFQTNPSPLPPQMISNQLKENVIQEWLLYVIRSFLQVSFRFQYQLINLVWLSFDFFSFNWTLTICNQPVLFPQLANVNKVWNNNPTMHMNERNQNKNKTKSHHIQTNYETTTPPCMWTNEIKTKTKPSHITFKLTTHSVVRFSPQKEDFLSIMYSCLAQYDVWSWRRSNFL